MLTSIACFVSVCIYESGNLAKKARICADTQAAFSAGWARGINGVPYLVSHTARVAGSMRSLGWSSCAVQPLAVMWLHAGTKLAHRCFMDVQSGQTAQDSGRKPAADAAGAASTEAATAAARPQSTGPGAKEESSGSTTATAPATGAAAGDKAKPSGGGSEKAAAAQAVTPSRTLRSATSSRPMRTRSNASADAARKKSPARAAPRTTPTPLPRVLSPAPEQFNGTTQYNLQVCVASSVHTMYDNVTCPVLA